MIDYQLLTQEFICKMTFENITYVKLDYNYNYKVVKNIDILVSNFCCAKLSLNKYSMTVWCILYRY